MKATIPFAGLNLPLKKVDAPTIEQNNRLNWRKNLLLKYPPLARIASVHLGIDTYESKALI